MKKYTLLFVPLLVLTSLGFQSCTNSHEDDIIKYVPKQVRELTTNEEATKTKTIYSHTYDSEGRIKTEADTLYTAYLHYNSENMVDSVRLVYTSETVDSITYSEGGISVRQVTFTNGLPDGTTVFGSITLNAQQLPQSYTIDNVEERYSYDANSRLAAVEQYENGVHTKTYSYSYNEEEKIKSPYDEVQYFPAWYFVIYQHISPVELITKVEVEENGSSAKAVYELSNFTLSDLLFITHATKTYYENEGTREVAYRQDYQKVVFD